MPVLEYRYHNRVATLKKKWDMHYSLLESLRRLTRTLCVSLNGLNFLSRQSNIFGASSGEFRLNSNLTYSNYSTTETR